jgi:hypothetical protein
MAEQQFTDDYEAPEADAAEQSLPVDEEQENDADGELLVPEELPVEADPADAIDQVVPVPLDDDEYR